MSFIFYLVVSYVIHNFYNISRVIIITPRLKQFIVFLNNDKIFFFFKLNMFLKFLNKSQIFNSTNIALYFRFLFLENTFHFFHKIFGYFKVNYISNFMKSLLFLNLQTFDKMISNVKCVNVLSHSDELLFNFYFISIKLINFNVNKKFYENIYFLLMFLDLNFWSVYTKFFKIYNNFLLVNNEIQINIFFNGFFFSVYNY